MKQFPLVLGITSLVGVVLFIVFIFMASIKLTGSLSQLSLAGFMLVSAVVLIFLDSLIPGIAYDANPLLELFLEFKNVIVGIFLLAFCIVAIRSLLQLTQQNTPASEKPVPSCFESFATETSILRLTQQCSLALNNIEMAVEGLDDIELETCDFVSESKQSYLDANMEPGNEMEAYNKCISSEGEGGEETCKKLKPSDERQKTLEERRKQRAQQKYQTEFSQFQTVSGAKGTLKECFQDVTVSEKDATADLQDALKDLEPYLSVEFQKKIRERCETIQTSMDFVLHLTRKGQKVLQKSQAGSTEGFTVSQKAQSALNSIQSLLDLIQKTKDIFQKGKQEYQTLTGKVNRMAAGEPTQSDVVQAVSPKPVQGNCPTFMFAYGTDAGGYCCPSEPAEYDTQRGQYLKCGPKTKEAEKAAQKRRNQATATCKDDACIRAKYKAFQRAQQFSEGCQFPLNPQVSSLAKCTYTCVNGSPCPYETFRSEAGILQQ